MHRRPSFPFRGPFSPSPPGNVAYICKRTYMHEVLRLSAELVGLVRAKVVMANPVSRRTSLSEHYTPSPLSALSRMFVITGCTRLELPRYDNEGDAYSVRDKTGVSLPVAERLIVRRTTRTSSAKSRETGELMNRFFEIAPRMITLQFSFSQTPLESHAPFSRERRIQIVERSSLVETSSAARSLFYFFLIFSIKHQSSLSSCVKFIRFLSYM